jgi:hypothetical protein
VIRSPSYLVWSRTFLLGVGVEGLSHFGRLWVKTREKYLVSAFNGSVVYFNVGIGLTFLGGSCSIRVKNFVTSSYFEEKKLAVECRWGPEPRGQFEAIPQHKNHFDSSKHHSKGGGAMSWRAQNRSKDAKIYSVGRAMSNKPAPG